MPVALRRCLLGILLAPLVGGAEPRPVALGLVAPPFETDAASLARGVQLAVAEADSAGAPVTLAIRSESGQWGSVGNDAVMLVCQRHVDALISPADGAATHLMLQVAGRTRVPVATVCADSSVTEAGVPWCVRVVARTDETAAALFAAARPPAGPAPRWVAIIPTGHPGLVVRRDLKAAADRTATPLDRIIEDDPNTADAAALARRIAAEAPDGALLWLPPTRAGALAAALRAAGYAGRLAGPGPLDSPDFIDAAGAAAEGVLVADFRAGAGGRAAAERFAADYRRKFGAEPDASAAAAHDAAQVLIAVLRRAGNRAGYRQFPLGDEAAGVTGALHFDANGNRAGAPQVLICRARRFLPLAPTETQP